MTADGREDASNYVRSLHGVLRILSDLRVLVVPRELVLRRTLVAPRTPKLSTKPCSRRKDGSFARCRKRYRNES